MARIFRKLTKWSLQIVGISLITYHGILTTQQQSTLQGLYRSILNSSRASIILFRSTYDYYYELQPLQYNSQSYHQKRSEIHSRVANRILKLSQQNKGIYLKLGQYLGNLERVVPRQFTDVLKVLQDSVTPLPYENIKTVLEEDLNINVKEVFDLFRKEAIAAASLAQVHRAVLLQNGHQVAVKIQYPFLKAQSKYDLIALKNLFQLSNYLLKKYKYEDIDLLKLFHTWTDTLVQQLDFQKEVKNGLKTRQLFKDDKRLYIPKYAQKYCSERVVVMEFVEGPKINEVQKIKDMKVDPKVVSQALTEIFSTMIFKHGFVHCDAHPGNIMVRKSKQSPTGFQIILLDHGLYRTVNKQFINNFSGLFLALVQSNKKRTEQYARNLNIEKHIEYLPIIFLHRTINSNKRLGDPLTAEERKYFRDHDIANFDSINNILQDLPPDLMFIIRASNLVASHCVNLGGNTRQRIFQFTRRSVKNFSTSSFNQTWKIFVIGIKIWIFQHFYRLYRLIFGTLSS